MIDFDVCKLGLTTSEALDRLSYALKAELQNCECSRHFLKGLNTWVCDAYHHNSAHSSFRWTSAVIVILEIFAFLLYHSYGSDSYRLKSLEAEIFFLFLFLFVNLYLVGWDSMLRHTEMHTRAETMLQAIQDCKIHQPWKIGQYPHLHTPQSPCISVQWTYRDNQLVNLPCHLLVEGDIIVLRPGHISPGKCQSFTEESKQSYELSGGTIFAPANEYSSEGFSSPRLRKPVKPSKFIMLETPYVNSFRLALQYSLHRPVTLFNRERHTVISHYLEHIIIPAVVAVALCVGALHAAYLAPAHSEWTEQMLLRPSLAVLPLLPLALPLCWILLNTYGMARLLTIVHLSKNKEVSCSETHDLEWKPVDPFEEMEEIAPTICTKSVNWMELKTNFIDLLLAKKGCLWRSANLLQVLGSITALCCVDKKGILSWPNPTAEKVFFLKPPKSKAASEDNTYLFNNSVDAEEKCDVLQLFKEEETLLELKRMIKMNKKKDLRDHMYHPGSQVEVLDLTHNINSPFGIQFDDPNWKSYIGNLKPLGLGILLNTCNPAAQQHYSKFCDHIACESLYNDAAVPVVNKRCLCELAKQIGFTNSVVDFYELQQQLGLFRHVHPEVIQKGRLARTLNYPRLKMPFPNISCAIVKDLHRGSFQLFSQGTADLVLDACNEYWNGEDICILTESDRKRILDFYHRSSLTAHCMGYAYCPLSMVLSNFFSEAYIELPADSSHLFPSLKSINTSLRSWDQQSFDGCNRPFLNRYLSSDSLLLQDQEDINDDPVAETNNCLHQLGNEIFIGMVTMQYQACPDFVQLIEHLDKACIRFVHFSKENELRSRVFSEKMGLESGWNCHISLLSEKNWSENSHSKNFQTSQTPFGKSTLQCKLVSTDVAQNNCQSTKTPLRCVSAPSIVNLDTTVVKFEDEISIHSKSEDSLSTTGLFTSRPDGDNEQVGLGDHISNFQTNADSSVQEILIMDDSNLSHSPSHVTESTDQSAPVTFDMSNRAKLPKGTENIRPHIENVDNVPLLVSLFTDCTPEATREMICIMQEYGEVVCCLGSSANCQNMPILLQADVSIAIEPLHPQLCMQQPVFEIPLNEEKTGPTELSCILNSLPCALSFHRDDPVSLYHLIMEARHFMSTMRNSFQFILCCCLSVTLLQMLAAVFFLPLPLPPAHLLWLICLEIPLLSFSLLGNPVDSQVTTLATGKNLKVVNKQTIVFFLACYCAKFCPSVIVALSCFTSIIAKFCHQQSDKAPGPCWIFLNIGHGKHDAAKESWKAGLTISQNTLAFLLVIYFVLISLGFIHRSHLLWKSNLFVNKCWLIIAPIVILLQLIFSLIDVSVHVTEGDDPKKFFAEVPYYVWLLGCLWPLLLVPLNELVKQHEIKVNVRQQKKARLEFGTKLGMNSPF